MLQKMVNIFSSSPMLRFWNSLPPAVAQAPSSSAFKRLIEFYVEGSRIILAMLVVDHCCMQKLL